MKRRLTFLFQIEQKYNIMRFISKVQWTTDIVKILLKIFASICFALLSFVLLVNKIMKRTKMLCTFFKCLKSSFCFAQYLKFHLLYWTVFCILSLSVSLCFVMWGLCNSVPLWFHQQIKRNQWCSCIVWTWKMKSNGSFSLLQFHHKL